MRLIDADQMINNIILENNNSSSYEKLGLLVTWIKNQPTIDITSGTPCKDCVYYNKEDKIAATPTVNTAPVIHGRWKDNGNGTVSCSRCSTWFPKERKPYMRFCGYCGVRMENNNE